MSTNLEYTYIKRILQLIKNFNFTSTFNQQQKLIIVLCHRVKSVFMETFLYQVTYSCVYSVEAVLYSAVAHNPLWTLEPGLLREGMLISLHC